MNCEYIAVATVLVCVCVCGGLYSHGRASVYSSSGDMSPILRSGATRQGRDRCQGSQCWGLWITDWGRCNWWKSSRNTNWANNQESCFSVFTFWRWVTQSTCDESLLSLRVRHTIAFQLCISEEVAPSFLSTYFSLCWKKRSAHLPSLCTVNHSSLLSVSLSTHSCMLDVGPSPFQHSSWYNISREEVSEAGTHTHTHTHFFLNHIFLPPNLHLFPQNFKKEVDIQTKQHIHKLHVHNVCGCMCTKKQTLASFTLSSDRATVVL